METSKKQAWKRLLTIVLALAMICTTVSVPAYADEVTTIAGDSERGWILTSDGVLTISNMSLVEKDYQDYTSGEGKNPAPWISYAQANEDNPSENKIVIKFVKFQGDRPKQIGKNTFVRCKSLANFDFTGITAIGESAFEASGLTTVTMPTQITTIGKYAFKECRTLQSVVIQEGVAAIEREAFYNCTSLETVEILNSLNDGTNIQRQAFGAQGGGNSSALKSIVLPAKANIEQSEDTKAFYNCMNLKKIYFLGDIAENAFTISNVFGTKDKSATIYYDQNNAPNLHKYLTSGAGKNSYNQGGYVELAFDGNGDKKTITYDSQSDAIYTGTIDGVITVKNNVDWTNGISFDVTGKNGDNKVIASTSDSETGRKITTKVTETNGKKTLEITVPNVKTLDAGSYTFDIRMTEGSETHENVAQCTLTVEKKKLKDVTLSNKVISNAASTVQHYLGPTTSGGAYETPTTTGLTGITCTVDNVTNRITITATDNAASNNGTITIPVAATDNYEAYNYTLPITIKASPSVVDSQKIVKTHDTITISDVSNTSDEATKCEYAVRKDEENSNWLTQWKELDNNGNVEFAGLKENTSYIVGVRYAAVGEVGSISYVAPTLPSETSVTTLPAPPTIEGSCTIDYTNETITPNSGYEIREKDSASYASDAVTIDWSKTYEVRKAAVSGASEASAPTEYTPSRPNTPNLTTDSVSTTVTDTKITVTNPNSAWEYVIVGSAFVPESAGSIANDKWRSINNDSEEGTPSNIEFDQSTEGTNTTALTKNTAYQILVRVKATASAFASVASTLQVKTKDKKEDSDVKGTLTDIFTNMTQSSDQIMIKATAGCEYLLVPENTTDYSSIVNNSKATWTQATSNATLTLPQYYDSTKSGSPMQQVKEGTKYKVLVRYYGSDTMMQSEAELSTETVSTLQAAPASKEEVLNPDNADHISIDYTAETVTIQGNLYEIYVPQAADATAPDNATVATSPDAGGKIGITTALDAKKPIYVRKKAKDAIPASEWLGIDLTGRPATPTLPTISTKDNTTDTSITIPANSNYEYIVVKKPTSGSTTLTEADWAASLKPTGGTLEIKTDKDRNDLTANTDYEIFVRQKATSDTPASKPARTEIKTKSKAIAPGVNEIVVDDAQNTASSISVNGVAGYEYILVPAEGTALNEIPESAWTEAVKASAEQTKVALNKYYDKDSKTFKNVSAGTAYKVVVRKAGNDDTMPSDAVMSTEAVYTRPQAPTSADAEGVLGTADGISIDYVTGKITFENKATDYEIGIAEGDAEPQESSVINSISDDTQKTIADALKTGKKIYIRKKAAGTIPASAWTLVSIGAAITPKDISLKAGEKKTLTVTLSPKQQGSETLTWKWESSDPTIVAVDAKIGAVTAVKAGGPVTITATLMQVTGEGEGQTETPAASGLTAKATVTVIAASSGASGGGYIPPTTGSVTTTGSGADKVTTAAADVKNETTTDASGKQETIAKITVSAANQRETISQARTNKSKQIVIKVSEKDIQSGAKLELSLDKSFIDAIVKDTEASLKIEMPNSAKTFTRNELAQLAASADGNTVTVDLAETGEQPTDPADKNAKIIQGVKNTDITLKSAKGKKRGILLTWTKEKGYKVDYYEIYRSTKKNSGYGKKPFFRTKDGSVTKYMNTKNVKAGKTYYYKIRGVRVVDGKKYYTEYSNKAYRATK